jgi:hypothetical protein
MTSDEIIFIINGMKKGKRKSALLSLHLSVIPDGFWERVKAGEWGKAAALLPDTPAFNVQADMIWEG